MPLTAKGEEIKSAMQKEYGEKKGEEVFYASKNAGKITGVDEEFIQEPGGHGYEVQAQEGSGGNTIEDAGVGAESWVGNKRSGYSINTSGDARDADETGPSYMQAQPGLTLAEIQQRNSTYWEQQKGAGSKPTVVSLDQDMGEFDE